MYKIPLCVLKYLAVILIVTTNTWVEGVKRELKVHVNPGCTLTECLDPDANQSALNLIHIEANGPNDTIHYLWSTINLPTIVVAQTSKAAALEADWSEILKLQNGALWFTEEPVQFIALILTQLWSYVDDKDTADMAKGNEITSLDVSDLRWDLTKLQNGTEHSIVTTLISASKNETLFNDGGMFNVEFSAGASPEQSDEYPHLGFNGNSTQMRILFTNLATSKKQRFAAEFMAFSSHTLKDTWIPNVHSTIDDEYSPGVFKRFHCKANDAYERTHFTGRTSHGYFKVNMLYPPCDNCSEKKSFLMWKPVAYLGDKPTVVNSSDAAMSEATYPSIIPLSIVSMLFDNKNEISSVAWNMTFGTSGDGFYERTKYTAWSIMVGTGQPVFEKISVLAKVVIAVGLGTPGVIMLGGGLYLCYKKFRKEDDDDLLLEG